MRSAATVTLRLLLGAAALAAAGRAMALEKRLTPTLRCRVQVGVGRAIRQGSMMPIIIEFRNDGDPLSLRVTAGPTPRVSVTFSLETGRRIKRCLYVPVYNDLRYSLSQLQFARGRGNEPFAQLSLRNVMGTLDHFQKMPGAESVSFRPVPAPAQDPGKQLIGISLSRDAELPVVESLFQPYSLRISRASLGMLPDDWRGYSGLDIIVVEQDVWASTSFNRKAVIDWMAMGGIALIVDAHPAARDQLRRTLRNAAPFHSLPAQDSAGDKMLVGMGGAAFVTRQFLMRPNPKFLDQSGLLWGLMGRLSAHRLGGAPQIEGIGELPFWPVLAALILFTLVVGPLGWWYLVKLRGRLLLYYAAAPAASLCAMALTIGLAVMHEGIRPYATCLAVRCLDQRAQIRIDLAQFGVYAPFSLGTGLTGRPEELPHLFPSPGFYRRYDRSASLMPVIEHIGTEVRYSGVLPVRTPVWLGHESLAAERRRLVVGVQPDGTLFVENLLGVDLAGLVVHHQGAFARFDRVPDGARQTGSPMTRGAAETALNRQKARLNERRHERLSQKVRDLMARRWREQFLAENGYFADAPGLADDQIWLDVYRLRGVTAVILGLY